MRDRSRLLLHEWEALDLYGETPRWETLRRALDLTVPDLGRLIGVVTQDRVRLPGYCTNGWHAFVLLAGHNADASGLPPGMLLIEHLLHRPEAADVVGELRAWNDHFAAAWSLVDGPGGLAELRVRLAEDRRAQDRSAALGGAFVDPDDPPPDIRAIKVFVKVAPDLAPVARPDGPPDDAGPRYRISAAVGYAESTGLVRASDCEPKESVSAGELAVAVAKMLNRLEHTWASRSERVVLEFFLPVELLNEPVEWWDGDPDIPYANPLLNRYRRIAMHSLDRVQRRELHHPWRARWAVWKEQSQGGGDPVHACVSQGLSAREYLGRLDARIGRREAIVGMLLSEAPTTTAGSVGLQELSLGLRKGVPVFIWHRYDSASAKFRSMVDEVLVGEGLSNLPESAQKWKADSAAGDADSLESLIVDHVNVVWDDPEQLLDGGPCAPAAFVGGLE
nr:hypothetical protein [Streptomyces sp. SID3343]